MKQVWALLSVLVLVSACGPALQKLPEAPLTSPEPVVQTPAPEVQAPPVDYSMTDATRAKLLSGFKSVTRYAVSETYVQLSSGKHHTFGVAFTNRELNKDKFLVDVQFKKAYDKNTNAIENANAAQVVSWLAQNDWSVTVLEPNQQSIQSVVIEPQNFADGSAPPKGTYVFALNIFHQGDFIKVDQEYSGEIELNVQVV